MGLLYMCLEKDIKNFTSSYDILPYEPRYEKTAFLHMRKQRHRSAGHMDSKIPLLPKSETSSL